MYRAVVLLVLLAFVASAWAAQYNQKYDVLIEDPRIKGTMTGTYYYVDRKIRIDYAVSPATSHYWDYIGKLYHERCTSCKTYLLPSTNTFYNLDSTGGTGPFNVDSTYTGCYTMSGSAMIDTICMGGTAYPTYVKFKASSPFPGVVYKFSNRVPCAASDADAPTSGPGACQASAKCDRKLDIMFVLDESGSVSATSFNQMKSWALSFTQQFTIGNDATKFGLVMFSSSARLISGLSGSKSGVEAFINALTQRGGSTAIGSGILLASQQVWPGGRPDTESKKVFIVMTDGYNNAGPAPISTSTTYVKNNGGTVFGIGVGGSFDTNTVMGISGGPNNVPAPASCYFAVTAGYGALNGIIAQLTSEVCVDNPTTNPCGAGCLGFCSCDKTCVCPSSCNDNNACTSDSCLSTTTRQCSNAAITCGAGNPNKCLRWSCDTQTGCSSQTKDEAYCRAPIPSGEGYTNLCYTVGCNTASGCGYTNGGCNDNRACSVDNCNPAVGVCTHNLTNCQSCVVSVTIPDLTPLDCTSMGAGTCSEYWCDEVKWAGAQGQCEYWRQKVCDDGNPCTIDSCSGGVCSYVAKNCDDGDACTIDSCNASGVCVHPPKDCDDGIPCTKDTCNLGNCSSKMGQGPCSNHPWSCITVECQYFYNATQGAYGYTCFNNTEKKCANDPDVKQRTGDCAYFKCESTGCQVYPVEGADVDLCGNCRTGSQPICPLEVGIGAAAGLGAAGVAGIVIASLGGACLVLLALLAGLCCIGLILAAVVLAVLLVLGLGGGSSVAAAAAYFAFHGKFDSGQANPLYDASKEEGTNPFYREETVELVADS